MKKAIVILGLLALVVLLAAPVLAEILSAISGVERPIDPRPLPDTRMMAAAEGRVLVAHGWWRLPGLPPIYALDGRVWSG
jgi:hypothetical protein